MLMLDETMKSRLAELLFHVIPDPDEEWNDEALAASEDVAFEEGEAMKTEISSPNEYSEVRQLCLKGWKRLLGQRKTRERGDRMSSRSIRVMS